MLLGINVHDNAGPDSPYSNPDVVSKALLALRPRVVRGISFDRPEGAKWLAKQGIGYCVMPPPDPAHVTVDAFKEIVAPAKAAHVWLALEGLNEPETNDWATKTPAERQALIDHVRAHQTALAKVGRALGVTVLGPSIGSEQSGAVQRAFFPLPMDRGNVHSYGWPHTAVPNVAHDIASYQQYLAAGKRCCVTEIGVSTWKHWDGSQDVDEAAQARILTAGYILARDAGATIYCPYELLDQHRWYYDGYGSNNSERNFGIFYADGSPKLAVAALKAAAGIV